jgi:ankyrin repeat protein
MNQESNLNEALIQAVKARNFDEVRRLVESGADVNYSGHRNIPPLIFCGDFDRDERIERCLVEKGADVNYDGFSEGTRLMFAAYKGNPRHISFLIDAGADVNLALPLNGLTPLHIAAFHGNVEGAKQLIEAGAIVNRRAKVNAHTEMDYFAVVWGETPLHFAAFRGHQEMIKLLLNAGANKTITTEKGETPFGYAEKRQQPKEVLQLLQ